MMRAFVVSRFGPPEVLKLVERPSPAPSAGHVAVNVKAIGLNFADVLARLGVYPSIPDPPFVPGLELAGIVESVGANVKNVRRGDRVVGFTRQGAYAERVLLPSDNLMKMPKNMSFIEAASLGVTYFTAYHGLITLANARRGERILVHAGAGGVGTAVIQLAKYLRLKVHATVGANHKIEVARKQGADQVVNYREEDFAEAVREHTKGYGVDIVMDSVGGKIFKPGWRLLAPMGRYILFGFAAVTGKRRVNKIRAIREFASTPLLFPPSLISKNVGFFGFNLYFLFHKQEYFRHVGDKLMKLYQRKVITPVIGATFPFEKAVEAHAYLQSRLSIGKVVLTMD
ncbi:MAG TPA: zinc-binding dehydrogenase [Bacteroidota bacterium]|nr:zinc-binding dehydrogenase [Bacteroidota bacterium]